MKLEDPFEDQIRPRKSIGVTDRTQAYAFGGPRTNALRLEERLAKCTRILSLGKRNRAAQQAAAQFSNGFFAGESRPHLA